MKKFFNLSLKKLAKIKNKIQNMTTTNDKNKKIQPIKSHLEDEVSRPSRNINLVATPPPKTELVPTAIRVLILVSVMLWNVGFWSITDFPQTLGDSIIDHFHIDEEKIGFIYTLSYAVSIFASPSAGFLISRFGLPNIALLACSLISLSSIIMYFAVRAGSFSLLLFGRAMTSVGAEPLMISQASASSKWFSGRLLSISMGLNLSLGLASGSLSNYITPLSIIKTRSLESAFFYYVVCTSLTFVSVAVYNFVDWNYDALLAKERELEKMEFERRESFKEEPLVPHKAEEMEDGLLPAGTKDGEFDYKFQVKDIFLFGTLYWRCILLYITTSNTYYMITRIITNAGVHRYGYTFLKAKDFLPTIEVLAALFFPVNSIFITKFGKKLRVILVATISLVTAYTLMAVSPTTPSLTFQLSVILVGYFFITYQSTISPCIATSVPKEVVSVAFSIASFIQAIGLSLLPSLLGYMTEHQKRQEYQNTVYFLIFCAVLSMILAFLTFRVDMRLGGILDFPENSNKAKRAKRAMDMKFRALVVKSRQQDKRKEGGDDGQSRATRLTGEGTLKASTEGGRSLPTGSTQGRRVGGEGNAEDDIG